MYNFFIKYRKLFIYQKIKLLINKNGITKVRILQALSHIINYKAIFLRALRKMYVQKILVNIELFSFLENHPQKVELCALNLDNLRKTYGKIVFNDINTSPIDRVPLSDDELKLYIDYLITHPEVLPTISKIIDETEK